MRKTLLTGLLVLVAGLIVPALAVAYTNGADDAGGDVVALAADDVDGDGAEAEPWIGVLLAPLNATIAERLGIDREDGVVVLRVIEGSPADTAGVERGDVVLQVSGEAVETVQDVVDAVGGMSPGDTVTVTVLRDGDEMDIDIVVGERPKPQRSKRGHAPKILQLLAPMAGHLLRADITLADEEGNPVSLGYVAGTVTGLGDGTVTVSPKDGAEAFDVAIDDDSTIVKGGKRAEAADLALDDELVVVTKDGELVALLVKPFRPADGGHKRPGVHANRQVEEMLRRLEVPGGVGRLGAPRLGGMPFGPQQGSDGRGFSFERRFSLPVPGVQGEIEGRLEGLLSG